MSESSLDEELESLIAIYGGELEVTNHTSKEPQLNLTIPTAHTAAVLSLLIDRVKHPSPESVSVHIEGLPRGLRQAVTKLVADELTRLKLEYGSLSLFSLCELVREHVGTQPFFESVATSAAASNNTDAFSEKAQNVDPFRYYSSAPVVVIKSTFVAHVAQLRELEDVSRFLDILYSDPRIARATHNIRAWRLGNAADNDDDGEDAAGGRLAQLLELMRAENVMVVVSRWFGGVLMGPQRFKVINDVARQAIEAQPWYNGRR